MTTTDQGSTLTLIPGIQTGSESLLGGNRWSQSTLARSADSVASQPRAYGSPKSVFSVRPQAPSDSLDQRQSIYYSLHLDSFLLELARAVAIGS